MAKKRKIKADDLYDFELIGNQDLSNDGKAIVFGKQRENRDEEKKYKNLFLLNTETNEVKQFTTGEHVDMTPVFSNNDKYIAFLSNRENKKQFQIYIIPTEGGEARKITDVDGTIGEITWSPDDKNILFTFSEKDKKIKEAEENEKGLTERRIKDMFYKSNGRGFLYKDKMHIWKVNTENENMLQLTDDNKYSESNPIWDNNGEYIYFLSNRSKNPEKTPYLMDICRMDPEGNEIEVLDTVNGSKSSLKISPDNKYLSYVGFEVKDKYVKLNRLWVKNLETHEERCLMKEYDKNIGSHTLGDMGSAGFEAPVWDENSENIYFQITENGKVTLNKINIETNKIEKVIDKKGAVGNFSVFNDEKIYYYYKNFYDPNQIYMYDLKEKKEEKLTNLNQNLLSRIDFGELEEVWYENREGSKLQGWILKPPSFDKNKKYPSILEIHGGPRAQYGWGFMHEFLYLASQGYVVFFTNPRGGDGYGEKHMRAIVNSWGTVDYKDLMDWTNVVENLEYIDENRVGVTGGSYGGYMTNWIITHTDRFNAAVTQRCVSNLISFWGSSDMNWITQILFGSLQPPWEDFENYWEQSPMKYIGNVSTPTKIIHSENDLRCDIEQAEQVYTALKYQEVDTEFIRYPDESHDLSRGGRTDRRISRLEHISQWFDKYLK